MSSGDPTFEARLFRISITAMAAVAIVVGAATIVMVWDGE